MKFSLILAKQIRFNANTTLRRFFGRKKINDNGEESICIKCQCLISNIIILFIKTDLENYGEISGRGGIVGFRKLRFIRKSDKPASK